MIFLQPVELADKCFLHEVLYWVAFQRLPVTAASVEFSDVRDGHEFEGYDVQSPEGEYLDELECASAGIPADPRLAALYGDRAHLSVEYYDLMLTKKDWDAKQIAKLKNEREEALSLKQAYELWRPLFEQAVEYPASRIFVALKGGQLRARGRLLPSLDVDEAIGELRARNPDDGFVGLPLVDIPPSFWSLQGMDFHVSAARNHSQHYCHVQFRTRDVIAMFPGDVHEPVHGVERIGRSYRVAGGATKPSIAPAGRRGRPAHPWDPFHHEVAALIQRGTLPDKKEAGIQYFQDWFEKHHGVRPSRAAVGEKLKPYYDRFIKIADRK